MRIGLACALGAALAAAGCESLGFHEQQKDLSENTTKAGEVIPLDKNKPEAGSIVVKKFVLDLNAKGGAKVDLVLKNEGPDQDLFLGEVEFGYPVPAGSVAPYSPEFSTVVLENFLKNEERSVEVPAAVVKDKPLFARFSVTTGASARFTTEAQTSGVHGLLHGTTFLGDRVEVVGMEGDLTGEEPKLTFTIQNIDEKNPEKEIGNLRYTCQFFDRDGKLIPLGRKFYALKPASKPLGKKGDTVTLEVVPGKLEGGLSLVGSKPVLFVTAPKK